MTLSGCATQTPDAILPAPGAGQLQWSLAFADDPARIWSAQWHLDGEFAQVSRSGDWLAFDAGAGLGDAHHSVLWTRQSFRGDVRITFDYTKRDVERERFANIIYIQATSADLSAHAEDIFSWNAERRVPRMAKYFENMRLLHVSFASFTDGREYVRLRRYPLRKGEKFNTDTSIGPAHFGPLFETGKSYRITVEKTGDRLKFSVVGEDVEREFTWAIPANAQVTHGRIGIRQMNQRSASYRNFRVYTRAAAQS